MARGSTRRSLSDLTNAVGDHSPVDGKEVVHRPAGPPTTAPLAQLVANPHNPRRELGDLSDLASIADRQLQPALVVTRAAYLALYPDDGDKIGAARWIVVNGCRREAAARKYGLSQLDIVVKDDVARDRITFLTAAIDENLGRRDFDVIEEAEAVEKLVAECGSANEAAERLKRTAAWVSQRRALLKLAPELQEALRAGELAVRIARNLAQVPLENQVAAWRAQQERAADPADKKNDDQPAPKLRPASAPHIAKALSRFEAHPAVLADALIDYLEPEQLAELVDIIGTRQQRNESPAN